MNLPASRTLLAERTHSRTWDSVEYGCAVIRFRRRARLLDCGCWLASGLLLLGVGWMVWGCP